MYEYAQEIQWVPIQSVEMSPTINWIAGWGGRPARCDHEWTQTGMKLTWCKKCDAEGYYHMGKVQITKDGYK